MSDPSSLFGGKRLGVILPKQGRIYKKKGRATVIPQSLFEGTLIRQGCRKKSYSGILHLTPGLTTSQGKKKESLMIVIVTLTHKDIRKSAS